MSDCPMHQMLVRQAKEARENGQQFKLQIQVEGMPPQQAIAGPVTVDPELPIITVYMKPDGYPEMAVHVPLSRVLYFMPALENNNVQKQASPGLIVPN